MKSRMPGRFGLLIFAACGVTLVAVGAAIASSRENQKRGTVTVRASTAETQLIRKVLAGPTPAGHVRLVSVIDAPSIGASPVRLLVRSAAEAGDSAPIALFEGAVVASNVAADGAFPEARVRVQAVDAAGNQIDELDEPLDRGAVARIAASRSPFAGVDEQQWRSRAAAARARLISVDHFESSIPSLIISVQPLDAEEFLADSGSRIVELLGGEKAWSVPHLVRVVAPTGRTLMIQAHIPTLGAGLGFGLGWTAPDVSAGSIWGTIALAGE